MRGRSARGARLVALLVVLVQSGCTAWRVQPGGPAEVVESRRPSKIRVTRVDGATVTIYRPRVAADSLVGFARIPYSFHPEPPRVGVPLRAVRAVAIGGVDYVNTGLLVLGIGGAAVGGCFIAGCFD
ncbi:MAG TPA: hypothetical protein VNK43_06630 [Gemmatimonadales bacterium]|nr:hypothetical protein [Gemmatimonadales bacterium]